MRRNNSKRDFGLKDHIDIITNIGLQKIEMGDDESAKEAIDAIETAIVRFFEVAEKNPEKFKYLVETDFLPETSMVRDWPPPPEIEEKADLEGKADSESDKVWREKFEYLEEFYGSRNKIYFCWLALERLWVRAVNHENTTVSRLIVSKLWHMLRRFSQVPENNTRRFVVERILDAIYSLRSKGLNFENKKKAPLFDLFISWYPDIVFGDDFDLSYLEIFDKYYAQSIRQIVNNHDLSLFGDLISYLLNGAYRFNPTHEIELELRTQLSDSHQQDIFTIENEFRSLRYKITELRNLRDIETFKTEFESYTNSILKDVAYKRKANVRMAFNKLYSSFLHDYKNANFKSLIFMIGPYCLFKRKNKLIHLLWEYKQPPDADGIWVGESIVPETIFELLTIYFARNLRERETLFEEDRHGMGKYIREYFILLLCRLLRPYEIDEHGQCSQIDAIELPNFKPGLLNQIEHSIDELIIISHEILKEKKLLEGIGLNSEKSGDMIILCDLFLKHLKENATAKLVNFRKKAKIEPDKILKFRQEILEEFKNASNVRSIYNYCNRYISQDEKPYIGKVKRIIPINVVDDRSIFIKDWYIDYGGYGGRYGRDLAIVEDQHLILDLVNSAQKADFVEISEGIDQFFNSEKIIMVALNINPSYYFRDDKNYTPSWKLKRRNLQEINCLEGLYSWKGHDVFVFQIGVRLPVKLLLFTGNNSMGQLISYSPLNGHSRGSKENSFLIEVIPFSEDEKLLESFISKPPEWLKKMGSREIIKEHLKTRILIRILERIEIKKDENFKIYSKDVQYQEDNLT